MDILFNYWCGIHLEEMGEIIIDQTKELQNEYGRKKWNEAVEYFNKRKYMGMIWQWMQEDANVKRNILIGMVWMEIWVAKMILRLQWNVAMWGYMERRGFNHNCITRNDIRPGIRMWLDSTCWNIVIEKGYDWWLREDKWVLIWDTVWLMVFIGL